MGEAGEENAQFCICIVNFMFKFVSDLSFAISVHCIFKACIFTHIDIYVEVLPRDYMGVTLHLNGCDITLHKGVAVHMHRYNVTHAWV